MPNNNPAADYSPSVLQELLGISALSSRSRLTPGQVEQIKAKIRPALGYLGRLKKRMEKRQFQTGDLLFLTVVKAHDAIHELNAHVHYLSYENGIGRVSPESEGQE